MDVKHVKDIVELLDRLTVLIGVPAGLYHYTRTTKKEQRDREYGTYNALDEKYLEFLKLCLDHPSLDVFDIPDETPRQLTEEQAKIELIAFTMLISMFERAFLMYRDQSTAVKRRQWSGWDSYIREYCERKNFRRDWEILGDEFDEDFQRYMAQHLNQGKTP